MRAPMVGLPDPRVKTFGSEQIWRLDKVAGVAYKAFRMNPSGLLGRRRWRHTCKAAGSPDTAFTHQT